MKSYSSKKLLILINLILTAAFTLSFLLGPSWTQVITGLLIIVLPGFNATLILSAISGRKLGRLELLLWITLISPIILSLVSFITISIAGHSFSEQNITNNLILFTAITFVIAVITTPNSGSSLFSQPKSVQPLTIAFLIFLLFQSGHFLLYRFLPEADPYRTLIDIEQDIKNGILEDSTRRTLFEPLILGIYSITRIPPYWIYKIVLPLFSSILIVPFYLLAKKLTANKLILVVASLSPFLLPVVSQESLVARPQLLFMISLPVTIFLAQNLVTSSNLKNSWWLLSLLLGSGIAIKIHELFSVQLVLVIIASIYFYRQTIKKYPLESIVIATGLVILSLPWLRDLGLLEPLADIAGRSLRILGKAKFDWWFIDSYTNVDGNQLGWPDFSWLFYYGYNLGLILPILLVIGQSKKLLKDLPKIWLAILGALIFLTIAELLPRFGLAYLPDRAMLFFAIAAAFSLPFLLSYNKLKPIIILSILIFSLGTSWGLTWTKQGRVSPSQAQAAEFIKEKTDQGAIVIAQGGAAAWVRYFAQREWVKIPQAVNQDPLSSESISIYKELADTNLRIERFSDESVSIENSMQLQLQNYRQVDSSKDRESLIEKIRILHRRHELNEQEKAIFINQNYPAAREVYLLYSTDFFDSLYGQRSWWRTQNLYGLDLDKFNSDNFELIYDTSGEKLWRVKTEEL